MSRLHLFKERGVLHLCEVTKAEGVLNEPPVTKTLCGIKVPSNGSFYSNEKPTCPDCIDPSLKESK